MTPVWIPRKVAGLPPLPSLTRVAEHPGVVVHCTGGSSRPTSRREALERVRVIQHSHTAPKRLVEVPDPKRPGRTKTVNKGGRGWRYGGYGFVVLPTGEIVEMRGWGIVGAHAASGDGYNRWLGVVVLGRGVSMTPDEQHGLEAVVAEHLARGGGAQVIPHNAVSSKACPGPVVTAWLAERYPEGLAPARRGSDTVASGSKQGAQ